MLLSSDCRLFTASILIAGRYRPVSYPDGPITVRYRFRKNVYWVIIWRSRWLPYWISRLAIIYANLCWQFQKLQTTGNILYMKHIWGVGGGEEGGGYGELGVTPERVAIFTQSPYLWAEFEMSRIWIWSDFARLLRLILSYGYIRWCSNDKMMSC